MRSLVDPERATPADLPGLLRAAGQAERSVNLVESDGTLHATVLCPARRGGSRAGEVHVNLEGGGLEGRLCDVCRLNGRPALRDVAREGACRIALEVLDEIGPDGELETTGSIWELLTQHGGSSRTRKESAEAVRALERSWKGWEPGRLGRGDEIWAAIAGEGSGPGIALERACREAGLEEYLILTVPGRYRGVVERHTYATPGGAVRAGDTPATYDTALTLWLDQTGQAGEDLQRALERARLVHLL